MAAHTGAEAVLTVGIVRDLRRRAAWTALAHDAAHPRSPLLTTAREQSIPSGSSAASTPAARQSAQVWARGWWMQTMSTASANVCRPAGLLRWHLANSGDAERLAAGDPRGDGAGVARREGGAGGEQGASTGSARWRTMSRVAQSTDGDRFLQQPRAQYTPGPWTSRPRCAAIEYATGAVTREGSRHDARCLEARAWDAPWTRHSPTSGRRSSSTPNARPGEFAEPALDHVQRRRLGGSTWRCKRGCFASHARTIS